MTDFVGPFELQLTTEHARQMESDGATVNNKKTLYKLKDITLMENNFFQSLNVSNNWNILISHKKLLVTSYN